jgi:excisionase family DNA binding protein
LGDGGDAERSPYVSVLARRRSSSFGFAGARFASVDLDEKIPAMEESFLTVHEVAELLKLNQQTVRNLIASGTIPAARIGRRVRIKQSDLERILATVTPDDNTAAAVELADASSGPARDSGPARAVGGLTETAATSELRDRFAAALADVLRAAVDRDAEPGELTAALRALAGDAEALAGALEPPPGTDATPPGKSPSRSGRPRRPKTAGHDD